MPSVEQAVKAQFARVFVQSDWQLFKRMAEFYLDRAAYLRTADMKRVAQPFRLLARNSEKRLFIGIGTELLLKGLYLKHGFAINRFERGTAGAPSFPFTFAQAQGFTQAPAETYMLNELIQRLSAVPAIGNLGELERGLCIAKVFRNKEGHSVLPRHRFDPHNYRDIEAALVGLYARGFAQNLQVRFSLKAGERGAWRVKRGSGLTTG